MEVCALGVVIVVDPTGWSNVAVAMHVSGHATTKAAWLMEVFGVLRPSVDYLL